MKKVERFEVNGYLFDSEEAAREHIAEKEKVKSANSFNFSLVSCYPYNYIPVEWGQGINIVAKTKSWDDEVICLLSGEKLRYVREEIKLLVPQEFMKKFGEDSFTIHAANFSDTIRALRDINQRANGDWRELVDLIAELGIHPEYYDLGD